MRRSGPADQGGGTGRGWLLKTLRRGVPGGKIDDYDPSAIEASLRGVGRLFEDGKYFPVDVRGWEFVPSGPALFVSNHSGGTLPIDAVGLLAAWYRYFGLGRPLRVLVHDLLLGNALTGPYLAARGGLRAHPSVALQALREGRDLLVMPGGDQDGYRPYRDRYRVRFGGRTGYARLALRAGVPIVPIAHAGAHETLFVLSDGKRMARALGLKKLLRVEVFPVTACAPWGITVGGLPPHIPLPAPFRYRLAAPIMLPPRARMGEEPTDEEVIALDERVRLSIQKMLDGLAEEARSADGPRRV